MKINKSNVDSWTLAPGGWSHFDIDPTAFASGDVKRLFNKISNQLAGLSLSHPLHISFNTILTNDQCLELAAYIRKNPQLSFSKLSLSVDADLLNSEGFTALAEALNAADTQELHLNTPLGTGRQMALILMNTIEKTVHYPVTMNESSSEYISFANRLMQNMWAYHATGQDKEKRQHRQQEEIDEELYQDNNDPLNKKIKLKELIHSKDKQAYDQYIKLEVQHIEIEQQVENNIIEDVIEENIEENIEEEEQQQERYDGDLIFYEEFAEPPYSDLVKRKEAYGLVERELFGNLPKAIKYLSPDAAIVLAQNLAIFSSLNAENIPQNFVLKKTPQGELVLDYDLYAPERKTNVFTPKEVFINEEEKPIYAVTLPNDILNQWMFRDDYHNQLDNLYIKRGSEGVKLLFNALKECDEAHGEEFLNDFFDSYLKHFPHWDHFLKDNHFLHSLDKIKHYDANKLACLMRFLQKTGSSRHDLKSTLDGFEAFWEEWESICLKNKIEVHRINVNWSTPQGGNPLVYMERLLVILRNARDVSEQLDSLEGLVLDNYGAYYASAYEGFKTVSSEMGFYYDRNKQDSKPFDLNASVYRVELDTMKKCLDENQAFLNALYEHKPDLILVKSTDSTIDPKKLELLKKRNRVSNFDYDAFKPPYSLYLRTEDGNFNRIEAAKIIPKQFYEMAFRFLGGQQNGISLPVFSKGFDEFKKSLFQDIDKRTVSIFITLFFISHERFTEKVPVFSLMNKIDDFKKERGLMDLAKEYLLRLYKMDVRLNEEEGLLIFQHLEEMNTDAFQSRSFNYQPKEKTTEKRLIHPNVRVDPIKEKYLAKLFYYLEHHKYALLKCLNMLGRELAWGSKITFVNALDAAEYFMQEQRISECYSNDLFLFSALINTYVDEPYYENIQNNQIIKNMEMVKSYLLLATEEQPNNYDYAFKRIIQSSEMFSPEQFIAVMKEIQALKELNVKAVEQILVKHQFKLQAKQLDVFARGGEGIKSTMIELLMMLRHIQKHGVFVGFFVSKSQEEYESLQQLDTKHLQEELRVAWGQSGTALTMMAKAALAPIFEKMKTHVISKAFIVLGRSSFALEVSKKIHAVNFGDSNDFEKIDQIAIEASTLANLFTRIMERDNFKKHEAAFTELFKSIDFSAFDYEMLFGLLSALEGMPQRDYLNILNKLLISNKTNIKQNNTFNSLLQIIQILHYNLFPSVYIENILTLASKTRLDKINEYISLIIPIYKKDKEDSLIKWMITNTSLNMDLLLKIGLMTQSCESHRDQVQQVLAKLQAEKPSQIDAFLNKMNDIADSKNRIAILNIVAQSATITSIANRGAEPIDYVDLVSKLADLGVDGLESFQRFYSKTKIDIVSLYNGLKTRDPSQSHEAFLSNFEKSPFGKRDLQVQFDTTHVERVINSFKDMNNQSAYTYTYRKQMMEAFLFINQAGHDLPIYRNKPAKDLTNQEIQELFLAIKQTNDKKSDEFSHLDPFQRRLYALGLMREAMYRSTGQFPYSTQMIALIDCMMHQGDVISNIDMGQGKSLIDTMKATLLWLESDRVDVTTSSMVDAKRDLEIYSPFLSLLGIPHAKSPIAASSPASAYQLEGINYGTMSQFALFYSKAKGEGAAIGKETDRVSLVMNESDYTILDDKTIYRYATSSHVGVGNEWIYEAINEFVTKSKFTENSTTTRKDIAELKKHLLSTAKEKGKSAKFLSKYFDEQNSQLITWLESAIIVNYRLREKFDYVISQEPEERIVNGVLRTTYVAKILMKNGKVSPDTQYGNGMQQLLHAKLNSKYGTDSFIIEPESRTIISLNNRNMIDYYRSRYGYIWGSSGTVGYGDEIDIQYLKYGFEFSKVEPHQEKAAVVHDMVIVQKEEEHFKALIQQLKRDRAEVNVPPALMFFKDIETAERFHERLKQEIGNAQSQLYIGLGNEEQIIKNAANAGMITVTTSALGRNTDILYNKQVGMNVYNSFVKSQREFEQRNFRTGRQGSPGNIYVILNQEDFPGLTYDEVIKYHENSADEERRYHEELYNVLGYFLNQVEGQSREFFRNDWAVFSEQIESNYRQLKLDHAYKQDLFIQETVNSFNLLIKSSITTDQVLEYINYSHPQKGKKEPYQKQVAMTDCTPPDVIAYHFTNYKHQVDHIDPQIVKDKLAAIFASGDRGQMYAANKEYIEYLNAGAETQTIRDLHQNFLMNFLKTHILTSKKQQGFLRRWMQFAGPLNKILSNENYLLMFKALTDVRGEHIAAENMTDIIKSSITTLLKEYLSHSWFISPSKKTIARQLITNISAAPDLKTMIQMLHENKISIGEKDIHANMSSLYRRIKPIHAKGFSRFQTTLDKALALTSSLSHKKIDANFINQLSGQLKSTLSNENLPSTASFDDFQVAAGSFQYVDKHNAFVVAKSIESSLKLNAGLDLPSGMAGRMKLFKKAANDPVQSTDQRNAADFKKNK